MCYWDMRAINTIDTEKYLNTYYFYWKSFLLISQNGLKKHDLKKTGYFHDKNYTVIAV